MWAAASPGSRPYTRARPPPTSKERNAPLLIRPPTAVKSRLSFLVRVGQSPGLVLACEQIDDHNSDTAGGSPIRVDRPLVYKVSIRSRMTR